MGKLDNNKKAKEQALLTAAYELFTTNGVSKTSVSDIADRAGVAKGTFYLYFADKYDLRDRLLAQLSYRLYCGALEELEASEAEMSFSEKIIFMIDCVLERLEGDRAMVGFIAKNLSWGAFKHKAGGEPSGESADFLTLYNRILASAPENIKDPEIMLFMIVELASSACHSAILYSEPVELERLKPYVYRSVEDIISRHVPQGGEE